MNRSWKTVAVLLSCLWLASETIAWQPPPPPQPPRDGRPRDAVRDRQRDGGPIRDRVEDRVREDERMRERDGDRARALLVPPRGDQRDDWRLGVYTSNTETGVRINDIVPNSPAWEVGLERGDTIVAVDGFQVGFVNGRLYDLGRELQLRADPSGRVTLLVHNWRNGRLVNIGVQLEPRFHTMESR